VTDQDCLSGGRRGGGGRVRRGEEGRAGREDGRERGGVEFCEIHRGRKEVRELDGLMGGMMMVRRKRERETERRKEVNLLLFRGRKTRLSSEKLPSWVRVQISGQRTE